MYENFPFWAVFFRKLRYHVILSPQSTKQIYELGIESKLLLPEQRNGTFILPENTPIGVDIKTVLGWMIPLSIST